MEEETKEREKKTEIEGDTQKRLKRSILNIIEFHVLISWSHLQVITMDPF